jgi:hypothetical protein
MVVMPVVVLVKVVGVVKVVEPLVIVVGTTWKVSRDIFCGST